MAAAYHIVCPWGGRGRPLTSYICNVCGYVYEEAEGDPERGVAAGTLWQAVSGDWLCPVCGADKSMFTQQQAKEPAAPAVTTAPLAGQAGAQPAEALAGQDALRLSARLSNLARGCAKQYLHEESALFGQLADFFAAQAKPQGDAALLLALGKDDLDRGYPEAVAQARQVGDRGALRALTWNEKVTAIQQALLNRWQSQGEQMLADKQVYVCEACGFIHVGEKPPEICPVCKVPHFKFDQVKRGA